MILQTDHQSNTWSIVDVTTFYCRTDAFKCSYFPHTISEWNKLDMQIRRWESFLSFKISLLKIGRPTAKPSYKIHNSMGLKFLTRLKLPHLIRGYTGKKWINKLNEEKGKNLVFIQMEVWRKHSLIKFSHSGKTYWYSEW